jgi:hypothetical protein
VIAAGGTGQAIDSHWEVAVEGELGLAREIQWL